MEGHRDEEIAEGRVKNFDQQGRDDMDSPGDLPCFTLLRSRSN